MVAKADHSNLKGSWSKTDRVCRGLIKLAHTAGPEGKLPTVETLCHLLKVSRATLNRAMGQLERQGVIRREHGKGIFACAARKTRTVGLLFGMDPFRISASPYYQLLNAAVRRQLGERGYEVETYIDVASSRNHPAVWRHLQSDLAEGRLQGLLLLAGSYSQTRLLKRQGIPFVGGVDPAGDVWQVRYDWVGIMKSLTTALLEKGCRRIGLICQPAVVLRDFTVDQKELLGVFEATLRQFGRTVEPELVFQTSLKAQDEYPDATAPTYEEIGYEYGRKLASDPTHLPDGLLIADDMMARGALTALVRAGIRIGADLQVATHVNRGSPALIGFDRDLIRVELDPGQLAGEMFGMLEVLMDGRRPKQNALLVPPGKVSTFYLDGGAI